jgi:hypothetical protein
MKKQYFSIAAGLSLFLFLALSRTNKHPYGFQVGTPSIKSISAMTFGPDGILFIGDSKSATVIAIDTKDRTAVEKAPSVQIKNFDARVAAALGTEVKNIRIQDIVVNPISKKIYCAVQSSDGTPVLLSIDGDKIQTVELKDVPFSSASLVNAPGEDQKDGRGRSLREQVISDINYTDGSVMISGLSNQEFNSAIRRISFPFADKQEFASLEIYHVAHGRFETNSPIRTFTTADLNGKKYLVASYTCTPLVLFPMDELKAGKHVKGRTVAEFGAGNSPIDMVSMKQGDNLFLVMANSNRPVMRVKYKSIESYEGSLTQPLTENSKTAGVDFVNLPVVNVLQMDKLDEGKVVVLQRNANGELDLVTLVDPLQS